MDSSCIGSW